ncbi:reverse transcriptase domain, reverse transcriptase zinc-binding domain protein [Tanacetum coccineum]|uniref:Reverse transcriptase domain, reverse transcriptase zinc-binding domain protein n=1 Tax=Tanacetum coccineum TaxID=301880 RepID=A0ABQ5FN16_9ASTR
MLTVRDITRFRFGLSDSVSDLISNGNWRWPSDWLDKNLALSSIPVPNLSADCEDVLLWRNVEGNLRHFLVACAWDSLRARADVVDWFHVVWFPQCIPRHAFHMWLVSKQKLKTQDRLRQWDVGPNTDLNLLRCTLCDVVPDSHPNFFLMFFFYDGLAPDSWSFWHGSDPPPFEAISAYLIPTSKGKSVVNIISRLLLGVASYYIWIESNSRLFKKKASTVPQIVQVITSMVRLKLVSFKFKKVSARSRPLLDQWKILSHCMVHKGSSR